MTTQWRMLRHNCVGHPVAALMTLVGAPHYARWVHYRTLPVAVRQRWSYDDITYDSHRGLVLLDGVCAPIVAVAQVVGLERFAAWWRRLFDTPVSIATDACGGYSTPAKKCKDRKIQFERMIEHYDELDELEHYDEEIQFERMSEHYDREHRR